MDGPDRQEATAEATGTDQSEGWSNSPRAHDSEGDDRPWGQEVIVPLAGPLSVTTDANGPALVIALGYQRVIVILDDGRLGVVPLGQVRADWRYNWNEARWDDLSQQSGPVDAT